MRKTRSSHINQLRHVWGVAQKGEVGDKVLHWNLRGQPHVLLYFCELKKTYHQGGTHTGIEEGVGPPPRADCDRSWVNMEGAHTDIGEEVGLWPIVGLPRAPTKLYVHSRSTKCRVCGGKSVTRGALHPHKCKAFPHWRATVEQEHLHRWK